MSLSSETPNIQQNLSNTNEQDPINTKKRNIKFIKTNDKTDLNLSDDLDLKKIKELNSKSVELIFEDKPEISLEILKKLENFLESNIIESKINFNKKLLIVLLHNIACCYQKLKDFPNCITYLDAVIYHYDFSLENNHNIKIKAQYFYNFIEKKENKPISVDYILELRFSAKFHLQMCAVLSQANRHTEALKHAKLAAMICEDNLIKTKILYDQIKNKNFILEESIDKKSNEETTENNNNEQNEEKTFNDKIQSTYIIIYDLYSKIINFRNSKIVIEKNLGTEIENNKMKNNYNSYLKYRKNEIFTYNKKSLLLKNIRNVIGNDVKKNDWIQILSIGNIMYLTALNDEDLDLDSDPKYELLRDAILEKIIMLTVSYFCIATEMRLLSPDKEKYNKKINGEFYHYKAVSFATEYLPVSCPILKHFITSYYKYYGKEMEIIPEGKIEDIKVDLIRSEIEINKDTQCFIKIRKINYINNNNNNFDVISNDFKLSKKLPILGKKLNIDPANILDKSRNKSNSKEEKNKSKPHNTKLIYSVNKNRNSNNNLTNINNFALLPNNNYLNIDKSKINEAPKFKLNFNKIKKLNSNKSNDNNNKLMRKISSKIKITSNTTSSRFTNNSQSKMTNYSSNNIKNNLQQKMKGYKTDRPLSNIRNKNFSGINSGEDIKKNLSKNNDKYLWNTSRYTYKLNVPASKTKKYGNLTDRIGPNRIKINPAKSFVDMNKTNTTIINSYEFSDKICGCQTQIDKNKKNISKDNKCYKKIKSTGKKCRKTYNNSGILDSNLNPGKSNNIENNCIYLQFNQFNKNNNNNNNNVRKGLKYYWMKLNENHNKLRKSKHKIINKNVNNIIDKLYRNLFDFNFHGNNDFLISTKPANINYRKYNNNNGKQIHSFNSFVTIKNPFKI